MRPAEQKIDLAYVTVAAELLQRSLDAQFDNDFDEAGRFKKKRVKDREYWYYAAPAGTQTQTHEKYVGPVADPEITHRVEDFKTLKDDYSARRKLVSTLTREARLYAPLPAIGNILEALWKAGVFRLRACLVGTIAYQNYGSVLGYRLNDFVQTGDIDIAQFHAVSVSVEDSIPPLLDVLRQVDPKFRSMPNLNDHEGTTKFATRELRVEFLTPHQGSDDRAGHPIPLPALGGAAGEPLRFMEFLIHRPIRAVVLHKGGIPVLLPQPARYAVHKLIVAARRPAGEGKDMKDLRQAHWLARALRETGRGHDFAEAYEDAVGSGPSWREALKQSRQRMEALGMTEVEKTLAAGGR
ncbi:MAG: hypothetical protein LCH46_10410 [Proteobacteria bacterium]|nr:hypothetical protein [Pseudomonadota bacterium]